MKEERTRLTREQAMALLPRGDHIHTIMNSTTGILIGADWTREQVVEDIEKHGAELSGPTASSMGHGMALCETRIFIETDAAALVRLREEIGED